MVAVDWRGCCCSYRRMVCLRHSKHEKSGRESSWVVLWQAHFQAASDSIEFYYPHDLLVRRLPHFETKKHTIMWVFACKHRYETTAQAHSNRICVIIDQAFPASMPREPASSLKWRPSKVRWGLWPISCGKEPYLNSIQSFYRENLVAEGWHTLQCYCRTSSTTEWQFSSDFGDANLHQISEGVIRRTHRITLPPADAARWIELLFDGLAETHEYKRG